MPPKKRPSSIGSAGSSIKKAKPSSSKDGSDLKTRFLKLFEASKMSTVSNSSIKKAFTDIEYSKHLPLIINDMLQEKRLVLEKDVKSGELNYSLVKEEQASKMVGLDSTHLLVLQVIERAGNKAIWTRDIRNETQMQEQALKKIYKNLENRLLIKPIYAVTAARKKLYMLYHLHPAREITGGPWYTELEFDHEFVAELRNFILLAIESSKHGMTYKEIHSKLKQFKVSRVELKESEVLQLVKTLEYDYKIECCSVKTTGESVYTPIPKKITLPCDFKWWDITTDDFHYRDIRFDDGIVLSAHEPHHHAL